MGHYSLLVGLVAILALLLMLYLAWYKCYLFAGTKFGRKGCVGKGTFCGSEADPGALSEAAGLYELGVRPSEAFCGTTPAPAAMAEAEGLRQLGWRPEHLRSRPACAGPSPMAISEAQSLQHAQALGPGAPYYTENFGCGGPAAPEARGEAKLLSSLQGMDQFAAQKLARDKAAYSSSEEQSKLLHTNPAQVSARQARVDSMREGFGGPDGAGFGWSPDPKTESNCMHKCVDGCTGSSCPAHCSQACGL